jgi:hypothetical protein
MLKNFLSLQKKLHTFWDSTNGTQLNQVLEQYFNFYNCKRKCQLINNQVSVRL